MSEYSKYLRWLYRRNLLKARGEEINRGLIAKLNRKMMYWNGTENYINSKDIEIILKGLFTNSIGSEEMCQKGLYFLKATGESSGVMAKIMVQ